MFTGIIEQTGKIIDLSEQGTNRSFWVESTLAPSLKIDQSVSHNGVCLTVEEVKNNLYRVTAIDETLKKTNLGQWQTGTLVNLERCMQMNGRIDGHIVQGHVDTSAICRSVKEKEGSWEYIFEINPAFAGLMIEKGSIAVNGISLTLFNVSQNGFTVAIIPYTYAHTNMHTLKQQDTVNIEFDMIGKYVNRLFQLQSLPLA
jgi:riboflavin synthase